jgi:hypothetical protein
VLVWGTRGRRFESCLPDSQPIAVQRGQFPPITDDSNLWGSVTLQGLVLISRLMPFPAKPLMFGATVSGRQRLRLTL